jgi:hypothetical protein
LFKLREVLYWSTILVTLLSLVGSASAQVAPIRVGFAAATLPVPIGQTTTVSVSVMDVSNSTVQLTFVGLRFEWTGPNTFFIGGNSDKGAVLTAGEQITYPIRVQVPSNVTVGSHKMLAYVGYRWFRNGNWSGTLGLNVESTVAFDFPSQTTAPAAASTEQPPPPLLSSSTGETVGVIVLVVAIALFLERGRIKGLVGKGPRRVETAPPPTLATPEKPETPAAPAAPITPETEKAAPEKPAEREEEV